MSKLYFCLVVLIDIYACYRMMKTEKIFPVIGWSSISVTSSLLGVWMINPEALLL